MDVPVWLADSPEIRKVLNIVLDRFDQQSADERCRDILLNAESVIPTLLHADRDADRLWSYVHDLVSRKVMSIDPGKRGPYDADWHKAKLRFSLACEPTLRSWLQRPRRFSTSAQWQQAVLEQKLQLGERTEWLLSRPLEINGRSAVDVVASLMQGLAFHEPMTLRQLSARLFWGDSKQLDSREDWMRSLYPQLPLITRAIVLSVHLPTDWRKIVFIENQDCYTLACSAYYPSLQNCALVYGSGFRSSAERIRTTDGVHLHFSGQANETERARFQRCWFNDVDNPEQNYFWGDLDFAGMQMLALLRQRFGNVNALEDAYAPMVLAAQQGFHYALAQELNQGDPGMTGCPYADNVLLPCIRTHGAVDQEYMRPF